MATMSDYSSSGDEQEIPRDPKTLKLLNPRRLLFEPVVSRVVDALGGYEAGTYRIGDEAHGCLKDLKKLWRKDDTDDERTVARILWEKRVLSNDLIPILLLTAGAGQVEDKRAISCADLISAMTWPIDMAEELAELDPGERADFTQLHQAHRHYKAAVLQPAVMTALFALLLPPLAKSPRERTLRDNQVAALVLYIVRNLAAIRDSDGLQSRLVRALQEMHITELLLTTATNADGDPLLASWNTLVLEILFLLFRGTPPKALLEQPKVKLQNLLAVEARAAPPPISRHSRFGTTIIVSARPPKKPKPQDEPPPARALVHTTAPTALLLDAGKRASRTRAAPATEAALADDLVPEARDVLRDFARSLLKEGAFNAFVTGLLKDIKMERSWATGDRVGMWVLAVVRWTTSFFLLDRKDEKGKKHQFGWVAAVAESGFVAWVLRRMRDAAEEKPKGWAMLYAGMGCLTQILLILDAILASSSADDDADAEVAQTLTTQLIYAGAPLDLALDCLRACSAANATGRGPAFLDAAVHFAYAVVRMLERGGSGGEKVYVRRARQRTKKGGDDEVEDIAEQERRKKQEERETTFSLEAFEMRFASAEITRPLLLQLARFKELETQPDALRRVVSLLHRVAVRAKAEGLFFNVSTLYLFQTVLAAQKTFPRDQPHRDLVSLVTFVLRRFFKALEEEPFLAVEAFFPKNRGQWKAFSSWEPPEKEKRERASRGQQSGAGEVQVKRGFSWSEQLGIAIAALVDAEQVELVNWTKDILVTVIRQWEKVVNELEAAARAGSPSDDEDEENLLAKRLAQKIEAPTNEMLEKMKDFLIPYASDEQAEAASRNQHLKLLFRLAKFTLMPEEPDASELQWFVGKDVPPVDLQRTLKVIDQFLETPINLNGKKVSELLTKTRPRRTRRAPSLSSDDSESDADGDGGSDGGASKKRKKKEGGSSEGERAKRTKRPPPEYKSAQFIDDSDAEYGEMDEFLAKEKEMRERIELAARETGKSATMKATGTKRRRKRDGAAGEGGGGSEADKRRKKRKGAHAAPVAEDSDADADIFGSPKAQARPRPRPRFKAKPVDTLSASEMDGNGPDAGTRSDVEADVFGPHQTVDDVASNSPSRSPPPAALRPQPRPLHKPKNSSAGVEPGAAALSETDKGTPAMLSLPAGAGGTESGGEEVATGAVGRRRKINRLVISDEED
ncbi:timeless protein-domain-containing protein [Mycena pura]|uniref:Timeless protein-domain-containing protein n=1 Tax=Mycena pura TaxID=153505 RepID=A0AAD6V9W5_9AGAR|nr:timeless protein-domain-containing protein [Mycena pura]